MGSDDGDATRSGCKCTVQGRLRPAKDLQGKPFMLSQATGDLGGQYRYPLLRRIKCTAAYEH
jgi:hypothetical protein